MTPARLNEAIEQCFRLHRMDGREAHYDAIARFLGVAPITLRRWLRGERPVPLFDLPVLIMPTIFQTGGRRWWG